MRSFHHHDVHHVGDFSSTISDNHSLSQAASDDPDILCLAACQANLDFDTTAATLLGLAVTSIAVTHLAFILQFLWSAAVDP